VILVDHDYHVVELNLKFPPAEMFAWLQVHMGPGNGTRWWYKHPRLYFANSKDHLMFLLKWGSE
jgi:hypothetical protein